MLQITEVNIFSLSQEDDIWSIEGEITFEDDLTSAFETNYLPSEDELESLSLELEISDFDNKAFKQLLLDAVNNYED